MDPEPESQMGFRQNFSGNHPDPFGHPGYIYHRRQWEHLQGAYQEPHGHPCIVVTGKRKRLRNKGKSVRICKFFGNL